MSLDTIHNLIDTALSHGASDLLLSEGKRPRLKISGTSHELEHAVVSKEELLSLWQACGADPNTTGDQDAAYQRKVGVRLRVSLFRQIAGLGAALRPIKANVPKLEKLGLPIEAIEPWLMRRHGLILVTGATGAGKSTSIASCLDFLNDRVQKHVISIEDPVEYLFESRHCIFTQREVGTDTSSFVRGLRGALRQAPDILFVGEIRDAETANIALQACETGHLVFSTLHSTDCADTIERLINIFPATDRHSGLLLLSMQLVGILSQMLLPTSDGKGMMPICEYMENSGAIRNWIKSERLNEIRDHMKRPQTVGCQSFMKSLIEAVQQGKVDYETAQQATANPSDFERAMRGMS